MSETYGTGGPSQAGCEDDYAEDAAAMESQDGESGITRNNAAPREAGTLLSDEGRLPASV